MLDKERGVMYNKIVPEMGRKEESMINSRKLRGKIAEMGMTQTSLAKELSMSKNTLSAKINGHSKFTVDEAHKICLALSISDPKTKCEIFLQKPS